jgi:ABC-type dipeptide/oligopeptide/nickel transport system permease subunit
MSPAGFPAAAGAGVEEPVVAATSQRVMVMRRLRRDPVAIVSGALLLAVLLGVFVGGPIAQHLLGHGPDDIFLGSIPDGLPVGPFTRVPNHDQAYNHFNGTTLFVLGADGYVGRDELMRLLYGGQASIEVALGATIVAMLIGVTLGALAGYFGGLLDAVVLRCIDFVMAFPIILLAIALGSNATGWLGSLTAGGLLRPGVPGLAVFIGLATWFYPARIVRVQVMSLRESEFVEGARMVGASHRRILLSHVLPHLTGPLVVYGTIVFATNVILEASISLLGVGIQLPNPSWGNMLSTNFGTLINLGSSEYTPPTIWTAIFPTVAILVTLVATVTFGEQVRRALDPRAR